MRSGVSHPPHAPKVVAVRVLRDWSHGAGECASFGQNDLAAGTARPRSRRWRRWPTWCRAAVGALSSLRGRQVHRQDPSCGGGGCGIPPARAGSGHGRLRRVSCSSGRRSSCSQPQKLGSSTPARSSTLGAAPAAREPAAEARERLREADLARTDGAFGLADRRTRRSPPPVREPRSAPRTQFDTALLTPARARRPLRPSRVVRSLPSPTNIGVRGWGHLRCESAPPGRRVMPCVHWSRPSRKG